MKRILIVSNMYPSAEKPYSGVFVKNQYECLKTLAEGRAQVDLFAMPRKFTGPIGTIAKYVAAVLRFLPRFFVRYDVIHVHYFVPLFFVAWVYGLLRPRTRIVVTFHGTDASVKLRKPVMRELARRVIRRADVVIAVGGDLANDLEENLGRGADVVLPAGVDRSMFFREPDAGKRWDFVFVGSFLERKGVLEFLAVAERFGNGRRFCAVGSGPLHGVIADRRDPVIDIMANLSQVEIRGVMNRSRFLLFPSHQEAYGLVVTEAMYCGTPPIVSPIESLAGRVDHGRNGLVSTGMAAEDFVTAARRADNLSEAEYAAMSAAAEASGAEAALEAVCRRLLAIYGVSD